MIFIELPLFQKRLQFTDEELRALQNDLLKNPRRGDVIKGSGGLRKIRIPMPGRGKRGGGRVIYSFQDKKNRCYLLLAYDKSATRDITPERASQLAAIVTEELRTGQ